ncbi:hypothetical protein PVAP13_1NG284300 [Panicum virgatum]|uniref:Pectinesterase inhibitor domain-containing protein n=1 Tax=Panicum virgatum TaxID=38727 RepID=A0A8T0X0L4_PANVG|nr:hypothetical protein PVAP13_1NG284300 [Panicum virgatum]
MSPPKICIVAPWALLVVLTLCSIVVDATVVSTCKAAASSGKRVNYDFCVLELSKHHDSPDADTWGLAKVATGVGAGNAENAVMVPTSRPCSPSQAWTARQGRRWDSARSCTTMWISLSSERTTQSTIATTGQVRSRSGSRSLWRTDVMTFLPRLRSNRRSRNTAHTP